MTKHHGLHEAPLDPAAWGLAAVEHDVTDHLGRRCIRFGEVVASPALAGVVLEDGVIEVDLAVERERCFHGVMWRARDDENFESFFVRPHQVGNPDSIQYTPVNNGISSWQLFHGPGFWAPIQFPIGAWFTIRVEFSGTSADIYVDDPSAPALRVAELKRPPQPGGIGLSIGGPGLHVARFAYTSDRPSLTDLVASSEAPRPGVIRDWEVSDPFAERDLAGVVRLPPELLASRSWTRLHAEPGGLLDLSRVSGLREERNTVLARATVRATRDLVLPLEFGFSDRVVVFLNGQALFRGNDAYRTRDYRFLGSIGYWDAVYLPLSQGDNELAFAVSEDFGGWGVQARFAGDAEGLDPGTFATSV
jgi:hypothetical protein